MFYVFFDPEDRCIGSVEMHVSQGLIFQLRSLGASVIGPEIATWKTQGIPVLTEERSEKNGDRRSLVGMRRVAYDSVEALSSVVEWMRTRGFFPMCFSELARERVKMILALPLTASELRLLCEVLSATPPDQLAAWDRSLRRAMK